MRHRAKRSNLIFSIILFVIAAAFFVYGIYIVNYSIDYIRSYMQISTISFDNALQYVVTSSIDYIGFAILTAAAGLILFSLRKPYVPAKSRSERYYDSLADENEEPSPAYDDNTQNEPVGYDIDADDINIEEPPAEENEIGDADDNEIGGTTAEGPVERSEEGENDTHDEGAEDILKSEGIENAENIEDAEDSNEAENTEDIEDAEDSNESENTDKAVIIEEFKPADTISVNTPVQSAVPEDTPDTDAPKQPDHYEPPVDRRIQSNIPRSQIKPLIPPVIKKQPVQPPRVPEAPKSIFKSDEDGNDALEAANKGNISSSIIKDIFEKR